MPSRAQILSKRARVLARRRRDGKDPPLSVDLGVVNARGVTAGQPMVMKILQRAAEHADVLFCSEVANVKVQLALGPQWEAHQFGDLDSEQAGCALAIRRTRGTIIGARPTKATDSGFGIRDRYVVSGRMVIDRRTRRAWSEEIGAIHAPPMRAWELTPEYMRSVRGLRLGIVGGDWNRLSKFVATSLGRKVRFIHILAFVTRHWIPTTEPRRFDVGSDHPMVVITAWP
jgi:hypothetical protein